MITKKPNIVVIWGNEIGIANLSIFTKGMMGYRTPNIDRIAEEGMLFTDYYGEQSYTAGRSGFMTGQAVVRTGLSKIGMLEVDVGLQAEEPSIIELLKPLGYATVQFGKNHFGDKDKFWPINYKLDNSLGFLYYLNAEETLSAASEWLDHKVAEDNPFFLWFNTSHMHFPTPAKSESLGQVRSRHSEYHDIIINHDKIVGAVLQKLDELGIVDNTIVIYGTDNGPHINSCPDGGMTPFHNERDCNWEGAFRVPCFVRWPAVIKPGTVSNEIVSNLDWLPTLLAAAGEPDIKEKLLKGYQVGEKMFKVHLDGYNLLPYLKGEVNESPRKEFFYFSDDGDLMAMRYCNWKLVFMKQRATGPLRIWQEPFTMLRFPKLFNLRTDPYEMADVTSNTYWNWVLDHVYLFLPLQKLVEDLLQTFVEFPPRQKAAIFTINQVLEKLQQGAESVNTCLVVCQTSYNS